MSHAPISPERRFWAKVNVTDDCWLWTGALTDAGYGSFWDGKRIVGAHRFSYLLAHGDLPPTGHLDHLCRVRRCVRPDHLEATSVAENIRRGYAVKAKPTHCPRGHEYTPENAYVNPRGSKECRTCQRARNRKNSETTFEPGYAIQVTLAHESGVAL